MSDLRMSNDFTGLHAHRLDIQHAAVDHIATQFELKSHAIAASPSFSSGEARCLSSAFKHASLISLTANAHSRTKLQQFPLQNCRSKVSVITCRHWLSDHKPTIPGKYYAGKLLDIQQLRLRVCSLPKSHSALRAAHQAFRSGLSGCRVQ